MPITELEAVLRINTGVGLDDKDFEYLNRCKKAGKNIYWFCKDCNVSIIEMMKTVTEMKEKHDKLEMGLMEVKSDI